MSVALNNKDNITTWRNVKVWDKQAEYANKFLRKGSEVFIKGREESNSYRNKEGILKDTQVINTQKIGFINL
jgi:single-strand DNA-binding protein